MDIKTLANRGVLGLHPYQPGKPVEELERELGIQDIVKLASNENPLGLSPLAKTAIEAATAELTRYPDANGFYLKQKLAERWQVTAEQVTLGNGSNEVLEILFRTFVSPDSEVIFDKHAFIVYALLTQSVGATAVPVASKAWGHDLEGMLARVNDKTRLICIANPNNPTGTYLQPEAIEAFLAKVPSNVLVVLDEAYYEYVKPEQRGETHQWLNRYPNLIISRTFSKAYGLAGLRVGYALTSADIADLLNRVREPFNCNSLALAAATAVLDDTQYLEAGIALNQKEMARLESYFKERALPYIPSVGNFITVEVGDANAIYQALLHQGVIVRPIAGYGMPNHLRVSIGTEAENTRFMAAMDVVLAQR
ncbi:histidinol-phosphate transaminase [Ferrimonas balearica]|uniref:histidinol-phosphate transaminase n=1 Tax=Ferrimonas balearica TaxID=44012 RepID=UPI001C9934B5|nr:histidinol-phosphate transaminase [Ferrimonas balearica]MBY5920364.1 histidinol-phosphate transaminase [Ferrimonas balearica]MBY5996951.1 histidinol-phosphate transaminase [Ferrimonas balearica]